jgi:hypothetical protein
LGQSIQDYENKLIRELVDALLIDNIFYYQDLKTNPFEKIKIHERRVYVGFHSSFHFLSPPAAINVYPIMDYTQNSTKIGFDGNILLRNPLPDHEDVALVFSVQYTIQLNLKVPEKNKPERRKPTIFKGTRLNKTISLGWTFWQKGIF